VLAEGAGVPRLADVGVELVLAPHLARVVAAAVDRVGGVVEPPALRPQLPFARQVHIELQVRAVAQALEPAVVGARVGTVRAVVDGSRDLEAAREVPDLFVARIVARRPGRLRFLALEPAEHGVEVVPRLRARGERRGEGEHEAEAGLHEALRGPSRAAAP
jgi:hypothetical protein